MHRLDPRHWRLWSLPRAVLAYVVVVEAITVGVVAAAIVWQPSITGRYWLWFGLLLAASVIHLEAAQGIERIREIAAEGSPYTHMQSVWFFAGVLILPMPLQAALIALSFTHEWFRVFRGRALVYRKVFSAGTVILAVAAAGLALAAFYPGPHQPYITLLTGPRGTIAILVAAVAYRLVNYALVVGAIVATNPDKPARTALGHPSDQLIIAASVGLGYAVALLLTERPWSAPILLVTVLALHMGLLLPQFRAASRTDAKTGLVDPTWWSHTAERELDRARRLASSVGVLMLDIDHFKRVNDRYGHLAGDAVLRAVSDTLRHAVRSYDLIGRWGGEEFAVLLPGIDHDELHCSAERIRAAISVLTVTSTDRTGNEVTITDLTVSIGAGAYPDTAEELTPLLLATDDALYRAKDGGRNKTVLCPRVSR